jgi:hypothetical protein
MQLIESINGIADLLMMTEDVTWKGHPIWKIPIVYQRQPGDPITIEPLSIPLLHGGQSTIQHGGRPSWRLEKMELIEQFSVSGSTP